MSRAEVKQKWQVIFADYQRSHLSIAEYCREQSISPSWLRLMQHPCACALPMAL
jgi:hypothetical protein